MNEVTLRLDSLVLVEVGLRRWIPHISKVFPPKNTIHLVQMATAPPLLSNLAALNETEVAIRYLTSFHAGIINMSR